MKNIGTNDREKLLLEQIEKLQKENTALQDKVTELENGFTSCFENCDVLQIETNSDFVITKISGARITNFGDKFVSKDERLKLPHVISDILFSENSNHPELNTLQNHTFDELIDTLTSFNASDAKEKEFRFIGYHSGNKLLLIWRIFKRAEQEHTSYIRFISINKILKTSYATFKSEIESIERNYRLLMELMPDGVTLLNMENFIKYVNKSARIYYTGPNKAPAESQDFVGKLFENIFRQNEMEDVKQRVGLIFKAKVTKKPVAFVMKTAGKDLEYYVMPQFNRVREVIGIAIVTKTARSTFNNELETQNKKLIQGMKLMNQELVSHKERIQELENNHQWFMKKINEYNSSNKVFQDTIKILYSFLDNLPVAASILIFKSGKYEYVNKAFERKFGFTRKQVLGKKDFDIFNDEKALSLSIGGAPIPDEIYEISNSAFSAKQVIIKNECDEMSHIIRLIF